MYINIHYDLLSQQHFYSHLLLFYAAYYHLLNMNISLASIRQIIQPQYQLFNLLSYQPLIYLNYHNIFT